MSFGPLHLANPAWVHGLWLWLLFVMGLVVMERRGRDRLARLVSPALAGRLVEGPAAWRRRLRLGLLALAGLAMIVALMRPQWGEQFVAAPRVGAEIMIALDVSRSMLADDARPSRLERAKAEVIDLLAYLEDDQVGLIAFAGRASVLSPLTPDKSFLRLALESAGPHSVSRGGTRLAEPILRAVAGLGRPGPAQRALILITDGEDHDSFALDAAKKAAAAGIKIITIGFGDEAGSAISIRDPVDGSRTLVRDDDGRPVVSRLNGELLREIALATDGAYVPAGTGVLDLASIYEAHIARLTRGQLEARGRTIRGELHPIFVALALLALLGGVAITAGHRVRPDARATEARRPAGEAGLRPGAVRLSLFLAALLLAGVVVEPAHGMDEGVDERPRDRFNRANARLAEGEADEASVLYREARRDATDDHALRHAASFNLGMAAVAQADALEREKPEEALARLHEAADWFREASAMRPEERDARHNLDVVLRRALILADAIARRSDRDVAGELDRLIEEQRVRLAETAVLLEAVTRRGELEAVEALAGVFDAAATAERTLIAEAETVGDRVADEQAILETRPEAERSPEELLRSAMLEGVLAYLDQGVERMGQTRQQLRRRSAERAYRRGAEALALLKRARDQLRDPVEQLGVLMGEVASVARGTALLASGSEADGVAREEAVAPELASAQRPAFLTPEAIVAETDAVGARVGELAERFGRAAEEASGSASAGTAGSSSATATTPGAAADADPDAERLRSALIAAAPHVRAADEAMARARAAAEAARFAPAVEAEHEVVAELGEARELFLDLRQLIEVAWETQSRIAAAATDDVPERAAQRERGRGPLATLQEKNRSRATRLEALLARERGEAQAAPEARMERAESLLAEAEEAMGEAHAALAPERRGDGTDWQTAGRAATRAADRLDALRMLFLSLVEQLERLAREQIDLADRTREAATLAATDAGAAGGPTSAPSHPPTHAPTHAPTDESAGRSEATSTRAAALAAEQAGLEPRAGAIADALFEEAESAARPPTEPAQPGAPGSGESSPDGPDAETLRRAADLVARAQLSMRDAQAILAEPVRALGDASPPQSEASDALKEALALLQPPPEDAPSDASKPETEQDDSSDAQDGESPKQEASSPDDGSEQQPGDEGDEDAPSASDATDPAAQAAQAEEEAAEAGAASEDRLTSPDGRDPMQLLQGVRDREAERRDANERRARERRRRAPVEKDW